MQFRELTDRYQLQKILKSTRFGTVLRATDIPSGRTVAVKLITAGPSPGLAAGAPAFEKLATTLAGLGHPNLPAVLDFGFTTDGSAFLVLELLEGRGLDTLSGAPPTHVLSLMGQALNGLEALAGRGLAHHNVSPDNLFLAGEQVKLLGLGTAVFRPRGPAAAAGLGAENAHFRAPELAAGGTADWRADLYSLALTTCQALGATVGFGEPPVVQLPLAVSFELENDEALRRGLERALRQRPGERPTPRELREALLLASGGAAAPLPSTGEEEPSEVLSAVDDEVLNALLAVPPPPPRPAEPPSEAKGKVVPFLRPAPATPAGHPVHAPAKTPLLRRPAALAAVAAVVVLGALAAFWLLRPRLPRVVTAPAPLPAALPKPPSRPPVARLEEAKLYLTQGEDFKARRAMHGISFGEQGLLSPAGCRELGAVEETLALTALERLPIDLANGLKAGDLEVLQNAVEAGAGQEAGLAPEVRASLDRARSAVEAYAQARIAASRADPVQVLESFAALTALLPKASDPEGLRGKAALALETQAEALVRDARYAEALARLGPVQRTWPGRPGLKERVARYDAYQRSEKAQEALLAALTTAEHRKKPWDGLQMLNGIAPTPHLAPRFAEAQARLEDLLARLDKEPPRLVLRDGYLLQYARGTVAELSFRATDDYEVKDVKLMARPQGGKFREIPLEKTRAGYYTVAISPAFHRNGDVDLYAVATDLSGHETDLGSRDKPLQLKRKQGFEQLIR
jgi:serine/threonine protein kinase